ncbi:MAG: tetratricopeptide repeat protein [Paludibacter sp.]|nr:tetratricopeptide repeat protein [Paludibacter sp.]
MKKILIIAFYFLCQFSVVAQWNTDRILTIGQNALYFEDYVLSIQYFNQVIKIKPYLAEPYIYRAIAKIELGDYQGADQDCSIAIERNPFMPQAYYARGFARRKMSYFADAISDFSKALEFSPNNLNLLTSRMDARESNKDYTGAMNDLDLYMKLSPKNINMLYEKGRLQLSLKDTTGAENSFNKYIGLDSTSSIGWSARAMLRMQKDDLDGALKDYNQAIKRNSTYVGDYINRGIINVQKKNYNQALSDYNKGIKYDGKNALAYYNRGLLRASLGDNNNALLDLRTVLQLDTANNEALFRKAMLEATLGNHKNAIRDYKKIIDIFQYFIPAYMGIAESESALGNQKEAYRYRLMASNIEKNKEYINRKNKQDIQADNKMVDTAQQGTTGRKSELFNRFLEQNSDETETESKYSEITRGNVQDKYTDVVNERNFVLTYYAKNEEIRRTNVYYPALEQYNKQRKISTILKITNNEIPLTAELINAHFEAINEISTRIVSENNNADIYFNRALEFALVQDFNSAIEDLNKAIAIRPNFMLAYFCRATIRYKLVDYVKSTLDPSAKNMVENSINPKEKTKKTIFENQSVFDVEMIMRDFEKVNLLNPDFTFSYYNKANILCTQKDFRTAIANYSKAIEIDPDFAEAFFNRGLTYLFIGEDAKGLADLSKSGELGIYKAYNLIQRFKK